MLTVGDSSRAKVVTGKSPGTKFPDGDRDADRHLCDWRQAEAHPTIPIFHLIAGARVPVAQ
jgi:hypothetical protein